MPIENGVVRLKTRTALGSNCEPPDYETSTLTVKLRASSFSISAVTTVNLHYLCCETILKTYFLSGQ